MPEQPAPPQAPPGLPPIVYATFAGGIDQAAVQRIFQGFSNASAQGTKEVHLFFQTTGGYVGDGVALYNFFKALPINLILYNGGSIQSIGVIAYLGAKRRKTSANASFMVHRTTNSPQFATAAKLKAVLEGIAIDDQRTETILKAHTKIPVDKWASMDHNDLHFSAEDAIKVGIAEEIGDFAPPPDAQIYHL